MATYSTHLYRYQPEKVRPGLVYRYTKSNLDGSWPAIISIYLASHTHIEVIKREPYSSVLAYVMADMNWELFCADHIDAFHVLENGLLRVQAKGALTPGGDTYTMHIGNGTLPAQIEHYPFHIYNFDFISFNLALPHVVNPTTSLEIGILDPDWEVLQAPDFDLNGINVHAFRYFGEALIDYMGEESYKGNDCRKYRVGGPGMRNRDGFLWVDQEYGHFVNYEHPVADNPTWDNFKLELLSVERQSHGEWSRYMADELVLAQTYEG